MGHINTLCGRRLREIRLSAGMTQSELGKQTELSKQQIYNIESGRRALPENTAIKISRVLLVNPDYLLCRTDNKKADEAEAMKKMYLLINKIDRAGQKQILDELYDFAQYLLYKYKKG